MAITPSSVSVRVRPCFVHYIYYLTVQGVLVPLLSFFDSQLSSNLRQSLYVHMQRGLGFQRCPFSVGFEKFCKFGGGGAGLRVAGMGAMGVCSARACVYNSSSEEEGEQDSDDSGSNGFLRPMLPIL